MRGYMYTFLPPLPPPTHTKATEAARGLRQID